MADDFGRAATIVRRFGSRSHPALAHSDQAAQIAELEQLREHLMERLDAIETLAQTATAPAPAGDESAELAQAREQRIAELEETERRLRAQAEQKETEWKISLAQLEADRRLLAEAWERVEQERIKVQSGSDLHPPVHSQRRYSPKGRSVAYAHAGAAVPVRSAGSDSDRDNPVTQAILRQFQTLCSDVRRSAEGRRDSR
jgi:hypothetical protein